MKPYRMHVGVTMNASFSELVPFKTFEVYVAPSVVGSVCTPAE